MSLSLEIGFTAPQDREQVAELEALGADSLWVGGHVASTNPSPEALIWLARLVSSASTRSSCVSDLCSLATLSCRAASDCSYSRFTTGSVAAATWPCSFFRSSSGLPPVWLFTSR